MRKYTNRARLFWAWLGFTFIILIVMGIVTILEYTSYKQNANSAINEICIEVAEKYPEVDAEDLITILSSDVRSDKNFFSEYGIELKSDAIILGSEQLFQRNLIINSAVVIITAIIIGAIVLCLENKRQKKLDAIAGHIMQINMGDYSVDMESFTEGELSALESEVYKTTIMLKEAADNSKKEKERLKESLSDISHQLKTPLTSLLINIENLQDNPSLELEKRSRLISNAKRDTNRISQMVKLLLTLSKLDADVIEFKKEKTSISEIISEAMDNVAALADLKGIEVCCHMDHNGTVDIICDSYWQKQALTNVLKNGIEHAKTRVDISFSDCGMYKEIIIENDGESISQDDRKKVFNRFYSGENSSTDSVGIGLSLANAVVKKDGGYMLVESEENQSSGVKFIMRYLM